ncbi:hypothetical protein ACFQZC_27600 [Streptacidiphilus monticola]
MPTALNTPQAQPAQAPPRPLPPVQPLPQPSAYQGGPPGYQSSPPGYQSGPPGYGYGYPQAAAPSTPAAHQPGWAPDVEEPGGGRRPSTALLVVVVVVVAALLGVGAVYGLGLGSHKKDATAGAGSPAPGTAAPSSPADSPPTRRRRPTRPPPRPVPPAGRRGRPPPWTHCWAGAPTRASR